MSTVKSRVIAPRGAPVDLRQYIEDLERADELRRVKVEVDWHLEAGAMSRLVNERRGPAPLFENVKGYPGQSIAATLLGPSKPSLHARVAVALGLDKNMPTYDLIEAIRERLKRPYKPKQVNSSEALCKEVMLKGDDADLLKFPIPWIKGIDGGRYVGTWAVIVTKDPDTGWVNWATYRCMIKDNHHFSILFMSQRQHGGGMLAKYEALGKPMPIALVIGAEPACHLAATTPIDYGISEAEIAGALRQGAVPIVKCETSDLEVPASAEIVIEAEVIPGQRIEEGPFGEYTGHSAHRGQLPVARVKCITHRVNPIVTMANMGKPYDDYATPVAVLKPAAAKNRLEAHGINAKSVYCYVPDNIVVAVKPAPGLHQRIISILYAGARMMGSGIVLVDEDVDVTNVEDLWWAICSRMNPDNYQVIPNVPANGLYAWLTPEQRKTGEASAWVMNATFPHHWSAEYRHDHTRVSNFEQGWSEGSKALVHKRWKEYGYEDL